MTVHELTQIAIFEGKNIRRIFVDNEWWFSVIDVIAMLTESDKPRDYWYRMKNREKKESGTELSTNCRQLKLVSSDGKKYLSDCANIQGIFRIIQSIPSPRAESFKQWLAKLGKERLDEIQNPELGIERVRNLYTKKGYPKEWIDKRIQGIAIREKLTDEWKERGAKNEFDYAILTNEIMQGAFDLKVSEHKEIKQLSKHHNLRDHMSDLELIITMLGEATTTQLTQRRDSKGIGKLKHDAKEGGEVAGSARKDVERRTGVKVVTKQNYLPKNKKRSIKQIEK